MIAQLAQNNSNLKADLKAESDNLLFLEDKKVEASKAINALDQELNDLELLNEKIKKDVFTHQNNYRAEMDRNQEL